jgi:hypothetical protein
MNGIPSLAIKRSAHAGLYHQAFWANVKLKAYRRLSSLRKRFSRGLSSLRKQFSADWTIYGTSKPFDRSFVWLKQKRLLTGKQTASPSIAKTAGSRVTTINLIL